MAFRTVIAYSLETGGPAEMLWSQFTRGLPYEDAFYPSNLHPRQVLHNAHLLSNTRYNFVKWNCEHFA
jgi:hypothetical protein